MKRMAMLLSIGVALVASNGSNVEAAGAKKGTKGVVEVEYTMTSSGSSKAPQSQREWRGTRKLTLTFEVVAGDLQAKPVTLVGAPVGQKSFAGRAGATGKKHEKTLGTMEAAIAKCKGDQDCEMRVAMEFMGTDEGSAMMSDNLALGREASGGDGAARYQLWSGAAGKGKPRALAGTYLIDQYEKSQVYDPACGKTDNICTTVTQIKGSGALTPEGLAAIGGVVGSEAYVGVVLDTQDKLFTLGLPDPMGVTVEVKEDVQDFELGKTSSKKQVTWLLQAQKWDGLGVADLSYSEPLKELRGEITKDVAKGYGEKMTVRWRFAVKP